MEHNDCKAKNDEHVALCGSLIEWFVMDTSLMSSVLQACSVRLLAVGTCCLVEMSIPS